MLGYLEKRGSNSMTSTHNEADSGIDNQANGCHQIVTSRLFQQFDPIPDAVASKEGILICGDYLDMPLIQRAMVSGRRAAETILARRSDSVASN